MSEQQSETEKDLTPRTNQVLSEPATVQACQADYAAGADIRLRLGWKDAS
ncbi:hypothetical protein [Streptomyces sp. SID5910]|nr:hypothetical protein [Streptomyces sp. SID5910]MYR45064.1 hypothetical protein [Streptomyces sp. SID5910]